MVKACRDGAREAGTARDRGGTIGRRRGASAPNTERPGRTMIATRFWDQLTRVNLVTFVAMGDNDVVVTRNAAFASRLRNAG
jgi:hypothetical protein